MANLVTIERVGFVITLLAMAAGGGFGWATLNSRIAVLEKDLGTVQEDTREDRCAQITQRRITAIERGNKRVQGELEKLADEQKCLNRYDQVLVTGMNPAPPPPTAEEIRRAEEEEAFRKHMEALDKGLGLTFDR